MTRSAAPSKAAWPLEAALFHFSTRDRTFGTDPFKYDAELREKARRTPPPRPTRREKGPVHPLPRAADAGPVLNVLLQRRTNRRFSRSPVSGEALASLLSATWGVQKWGRVEGQGRVALKTSPSAGARHPLEAYVIVRRVNGVRSGAYHFDAASHELVRLGGAPRQKRLAHMLGNQWFFADAAVIVFMVAVFERTWWRYPNSRAYRTVLIDAGHLGQTFCLVATALNLAPFTTMAFVEREVENLFALDKHRESPMYVVGVGSPVPASESPGRIPRRSRDHHR